MQLSNDTLRTAARTVPSAASGYPRPLAGNCGPIHRGGGFEAALAAHNGVQSASVVA